MEVPEGIDEVENIQDDNYVEVGGSMYGLVQAARVWYKLASDVLTKTGKMKKCDLDPCLFYRINDLGEVIISLYVDDLL